MDRIKKQMEKHHGSQKHKNKNQSNAEAYENSVAEQKMNINQKIGMLASIQQGLGGV